MKKIILITVLFCFLMSACSLDAVNTEFTTENASIIKYDSDYVKSVWFTYYELSDMIKGRRSEEFTKSIKDAFKRVAEMGFNTVTVQVRPFADALYESDYYPSSSYAVKKQGDKLSYDPLSIMCNAAKDNGLKIEAWVNPYRVSNSNDIDSLADNNMAKVWYNSKKKSNVYVTKKGIYFNPASKDVIELIVDGAGEIAENYPVDSIHFDDYFYPVKSKKIDSKEYKAYVNNGGKKNLADFRRYCVNNMISEVYTHIKEINSNVKFGISPASNIKNDYETLYADVEKWASDDGFCDYICPQIYFGFRNIYQPFMFTVKKWVGITNKPLYIGLPLYKAGKADKYAAQEDKSIINEFKNNDNIIMRQITYLSKIEEVRGFYVFSYGCLDNKLCKKEVENMLKVMQ
ncbi:MAG: hypothetical protein E7571_02455 [Ruminococcaceae bacterium]|nr:hypothetical protein [Oscillospiraceae bacterium]